MYLDNSYLMQDAALEMLFALSIGVMIFFCVVGVLTIIANWKIFTKAGHEGWKCLIPFYNTIILFKIAGLSPLLILVYFAAIIPYIGYIAVLGITIYLMYNLSKAFGKSGAFAAGLILLNTIFLMILAFGDSEYQLKNSFENDYLE